MSSFRQDTTQPPGRIPGRVLAPLGDVRHALAGARRQLAGSLGMLWLSGALLLGGVAIGVALSTQGQSQAEVTSAAGGPVTRQADREIVAGTIHRLEGEQADLKKQIADLRAQIDTAQASDSQSKSTLRDISAELYHQQIAAGTVPLQGQGVVAIFDDSDVHSIPSSEDPAKYILHEYDLRDMLNALWIAGAEAISLNGERIVGNTSLYCVGATVICNATRLSPPYEIHALGNPQSLEAALRSSPQMAKFNQRASIYDLPVRIEQSTDVLVPAYNGSFVYKYAKVQK